MNCSSSSQPCGFLFANKSSPTAMSLYSSKFGAYPCQFATARSVLRTLSYRLKNKMVPMGDYFYRIALEDVEFINLLAGWSSIANIEAPPNHPRSKKRKIWTMSDEGKGEIKGHWRFILNNNISYACNSLRADYYIECYLTLIERYFQSENPFTNNL